MGLQLMSEALLGNYLTGFWSNSENIVVPFEVKFLTLGNLVNLANNIFKDLSKYFM